MTLKSLPDGSRASGPRALRAMIFRPHCPETGRQRGGAMCAPSSCETWPTTVRAANIRAAGKTAIHGDSKFFWRTVNGNFIDVRVLEWCKLHRDAKGQHYGGPSSATIANSKRGYSRSLMFRRQSSRISGSRCASTEKFIARLDSQWVMNIPRLDLARASAEFYHEYVVVNETQVGDLSGLRYAG
jgi:hypothetical protein